MFLVLTAFQFGLSFNEHLKHEGRKRAQSIAASARAAAIDEPLKAARAERESQAAVVAALLAELASLEVQG